MSNNEAPKTASGWTDKERLTYLFALIENSNLKFDYNNTPRPTGRSVIACQRMMERMKLTLKTELEALKEGKPIEEGTPKKSATSTPRKRKAKGDENAELPTTPTKRGRKKKSEVVVEEADNEKKVSGAESETKGEDDDEI